MAYTVSGTTVIDNSRQLTNITSVNVDGLNDSVSGTSFLNRTNRIINGDMRIDQRHNGAIVTAGSGNIYSLDRWYMIYSVDGKYTIQQQQNPSGIPFGTVAQITSTSAYTVGTSQIFAVRQAIEGLNIADLKWGTSSASPVTISFWVNSTIAGTFGGSVMNSASNMSYPFSYSISTANTWQYVTITVTGPTSGTWLTNQNAGAWLVFGLGGGSTYSGTAGAWVTSAKFTANGAVSLVGTSGATMYLTGVQFEKGSVATPFEYRIYGQEFALCQRYFFNLTGIVGRIDTTTSNVIFATPLNMRSSPTVTFASTQQIHEMSIATRDISSIVTNSLSYNGGYVRFSMTTSGGSGNLCNINGNVFADAEI